MHVKKSFQSNLEVDYLLCKHIMGRLIGLRKWMTDKINAYLAGKGPASRKGTRMNVGGLNLVKFFLCGVYLSHLLERSAFDQRSLIVFNVPPFDSTTLAIAKNNARSHLMCITRAAPAWFEWSELFKLFDWVEFFQRLFFEPTARKIILKIQRNQKV